MLVTDAIELRTARYREKIQRQFDRDDHPRATYLLANLALEELVEATNEGVEPHQESIDIVAARLDNAAVMNDGIDRRFAFRSRLLKTWMKPIIWSGVINLDVLTDSQAKKVAENIGLAEAADKTAELTAELLHQYDEMASLPRQNQDRDTIRRLVGALGEATPILLAARPNTAKQFALPTLAYDNSLNPSPAMHIDGFYYDNRRTRTINRRAYQVVNGNHNHFNLSSSAVLLDGRVMGNLQRSSRWPEDDRPFATTRRLVTERKRKKLSDSSRSNLDRIASDISNRMLNN